MAVSAYFRWRGCGVAIDSVNLGIVYKHLNSCVYSWDAVFPGERLGLRLVPGSHGDDTLLRVLGQCLANLPA